MKPRFRVSIVIPLHWGLLPENFPQFSHDLANFLKLNYQNFEVLIVSDRQVTLPISSPKIKLLVTRFSHSTSPAEKRDFALKYVTGQLCAFIDDDAYPDPFWLSRAVMWFKNPDVVAVGGPGVTPPTDNYWQKIGGHIIESYLCSGGIQRRFYVNSHTPPAFVDDWPAYNLLIRTRSLKTVGGFDSTFYGGEDTFVCLRLNQAGKLVFEPQAIVYHHRRAFPIGHLQQIRNVGIHRGYFFKSYPQTSRRLIYLLPTLVTLGMAGGIVLSLIYPGLFLAPFLLAILSGLSLSVLSVSRHGADFWTSLVSGIGIICTHICYGLYFINGLLAKDLKH